MPEDEADQLDLGTGGDRFRHATQFVRWRPDKAPSACRYDQLEVTAPYELRKVFGARGR